jgi:hypothetical protein
MTFPATGIACAVEHNRAAQWTPFPVQSGARRQFFYSVEEHLTPL